MLTMFVCVLQRDLLLAMRRRSDVFAALCFFVLVVMLFPLGVGPEPEQLRSIASGIVWVAALLASNLALSRLFAPDYADGTLEQLLLTPEPLTVIVLAKVSAHWLVSGLPVVLLSPLMAVQFGLPFESVVVLFCSLLIGTPILSLIGAIGAALTLGLRDAGVLVSLLTLPLMIPVLIFGAGAVGAQASGLGAAAHLELLGGLLAAALALSPLAISVALRISIE
ncbi:heme exporter protein B [Oxalobacteraceae bacterium GrIS 2.11]